MTGSIEPLMECAAQTLRQIWGYDAFRPLQHEAVTAALSGRDSLVVLPTGGGKSLCFQVPALCLDGLAVVVSPLISLMKDQVDTLTTNGVAAGFINSSQSHSEQLAVAQRIRSGELKLLYVAPERLLAERMLDFLATLPISLFAIDEAHCISDWGHDFRPEYRGLSLLKQRFASVPVHAYTATANVRVRDDIVRQLGLADAQVLVGAFDRPNLVYRMLTTDDRWQEIGRTIERHRNESGIIYCTSRKEVERMVSILADNGLKAAAYHAGMDDESRHRNQEAFLHDHIDIVVATVAFGMGIDKPDVRFVIHANMPKSVEHYQQESGRAGRDGLESECLLLYSAKDLVTWRKMIEDLIPSARKAALQSLNDIYQLCTSVECRHRSLSAHFGQDLDGDNCGACDVCLGELELVEDAITVGQKILSCVLRLEERFGADYTAKVLTGANHRRIAELGHDRLSTYGLLRSHKPTIVRQWIDQLGSQQFLVRSGEFQTLNVTQRGRQLLKRELTPVLTQPRAPSNSVGSTGSTARPIDSWAGVDRGLFEHLRMLRLQLAGRSNVPAYVVLGDTSLRDMARIRPASLERLRGIRGIGEQKLQVYGQEFLTAMDQYCALHSLARDVPLAASLSADSDASATSAIQVAPGISVSAMASFAFFRRGMSVEQVAMEMGRAIGTVQGYLVEFVRHDKVTDPSVWVPPQDADIIERALAVQTDGRLKPIFESLEGKYSYGWIRLVSACVKNRQEISSN